MTTLETRRAYLVRLGLAKEGRGKFSNVAKDALAKADKEGYEFLDGPSPTGNGSGPIKSTADAPTPPAPVVKADPRNTPWIAPSDYRFPEAEYEAVTNLDGKRVVYSMRECCGVCRVSLVNHSCNTPEVYGNAVVIQAKK